MVLHVTHMAPRPSLTRQFIQACQVTGGFILTSAGAVLTVTPIPLGLPVMAAGLVVLTSCSPVCRQYAADVRCRLTLLDSALVKLENHGPRAFARLLRQSNPRYRYASSVPVDMPSVK